MKLFVLVLIVLAASSAFATDWSVPPVGCIEDFVPKLVPCLDLTAVANPWSDLPPLSDTETTYWTVDHRADLSLCRAKEVQRREAVSPGSQSAGALENAWMWVKQAEDLPAKIDAIYDAAETADMPPQILFGALKQESLLSNLGITVDGGNFSCGIGQVNVLEWCQYANALPLAEQRSMGWPVGISCDVNTLGPELIRPFYDIALRRLHGRPDYELTPADFSGIALKDVVGHFPAGDSALQSARFAASANFVKYCSDLHYGIAAKGHELRRLFDGSVPDALKSRERYAANGAGFPLACRRPYRTRYFPYHTGWLLADAIYNAGDREVSVLQYYYRMTRAGHESGADWQKLDPVGLVEGLHWGGKWNEATKKIEYANVYGTSNSQTWFKSCVVQRHIANVVQYTVLPGQTVVRPLEQGGSCSQTYVPDYRKRSPGRIPAKRPARP
ncbi:MAG: hypothetical protein JST04_15725 [Bdellovibrionales bacterium]|nr:hypothetical protein [Bdellovibrionales bacterium]